MVGVVVTWPVGAQAVLVVVQLRTTKSLRVVRGLLAKAIVVVAALPTVCKLVLVAVVLAVPVVASLLQARVRTDSLAVVVLVRPLASQAFQPPMQAVAAVQLQRQVLVAVVVWVAQEAGVLVRVTG